MGEDKSFTVGDFVFAKMRGFPPWPARVRSVDNALYNVFFFGTSDTASVAAKNIFDYSSSKEKLGKPMKRKLFNDAIAELEAELKIVAEGGTSDKGLIVNVKRGDREEIRQPKKSIGKANNTVGTSVEDQKPKRKAAKRKSEADDTDAKKKKSIGKVNNAVGTSVEDQKPKRKAAKRKPQAEDPHAKKKKPGTPGVQSNGVSIECKYKLSDLPSYFYPAVDSPMGRIMWVKTKCGQLIQLSFELDRAAAFVDYRSRAFQVSENEFNLNRLKEIVEKSDDLPQELTEQFKPSPEQLAKMTDDEKLTAKKLRVCHRKKGIIRWLKLESRMLEIDSELKACFGLTNIDIEKGEQLLDELIALDLDALMIKKHPHVVETIEKLTMYRGDLAQCGLPSKEEADFKKNTVTIRRYAKLMIKNYHSIFGVPRADNFRQKFDQYVKEFNDLTENLPQARVDSLTIDPTSEYFKEVCEFYDEEDELKLELMLQTEDDVVGVSKN